MSTFVKICGMTDGHGIAAAVEAGVDALGFVFYDRSPRNLQPHEAAKLAAAVPASVRRVAVMLHPDPGLWLQVQRVLHPDILQTDDEDFAGLQVEEGIEKWPVLREGATMSLARLPDTFVYEGRQSGKGVTVDWERAAEIAQHGRMILAGGLDATTVAAAIRRVRPYGVDVSSAVESAPGKKDAGRIRAFVAAARAAL